MLLLLFIYYFSCLGRWQKRWFIIRNETQTHTQTQTQTQSQSQSEVVNRYLCWHKKQNSEEIKRIRLPQNSFTVQINVI